jgi:hypothetical protein
MTKTSDKDDGWKFERGDVVSNSTSDDWEVTERLLDADNGEKYYRTKVTNRQFTNDITGLQEAGVFEERYSLKDD